MRRIVSLALFCLAAAAQSPFAWKDLGDGRYELRENGKVVLVYNYGPQLKPGAPDDRRRCCYLYPVYTPAGVSVLDDFPQDHWHHRGIFWSWPVVETEGKTYDNWMTLTARDRNTGPPKVEGTHLTVQNIWQAAGKDIVREDVRITAFSTQQNSRELEVEVKLEALSAPVTLRGSREAGKSYGGFSARFAPRENTILRADGEVLTKDEDLTPRHWAELEGVYNGKKATLRIIPETSVPDQWCLRNYGFVGASFPGKTATSDGYTLERGKPLTLKFRVKLSDL